MFRRARVLAVALAVVAAFVGANVAAPAATSAAAVPVRIWPLGDSITYGVTWRLPSETPAPQAGPDDTAVVDERDPRRLVSPGGYRGPLHLLLDEDGVAHRYVGTDGGNTGPFLTEPGYPLHDGHPSYRVDHVHDALDGRAYGGAATPFCCDNGGHWLTGTSFRAPLLPDVVIIHLGTNDIAKSNDPLGGYPGGRADLTNPAHRERFTANLATRMRALIDKIQSFRPDVRIVLSRIVPMGAVPEDHGWDLTAYHYNQRLDEVVAAEAATGTRIVLADLWEPFADYVPATDVTPERVVLPPGIIAPDYGHPYPHVYQAMAQVYREAVQAVLAL